MSGTEPFSTYHALLASQFDTATNPALPKLHPDIQKTLQKTLDVLSKASGVATNTYDLNDWAKGDPENYKTIAIDIKKAIIDVGILLKIRQSPLFTHLANTSVANQHLETYQSSGIVALCEQVNFIWERNVGSKFTFLDEPRNAAAVNGAHAFVIDVNHSIDNFNNWKYKATRISRGEFLVAGTAAAAGILGLNTLKNVLYDSVDELFKLPFKHHGFKNFESNGELNPHMQKLLKTMQDNMTNVGMNSLFIVEHKVTSAHLIPEKEFSNSYIVPEHTDWWSGEKKFETPKYRAQTIDPQSLKAIDVNLDEKNQNNALHACSILTKEEQIAVQNLLRQLQRENPREPILKNVWFDEIPERHKKMFETDYGKKPPDYLLMFKNLEDRTPGELNDFLLRHLPRIAQAIGGKETNAQKGRSF